MLDLSEPTGSIAANTIYFRLMEPTFLFLEPRANICAEQMGPQSPLPCGPWGPPPPGTPKTKGFGAAR